MRNAILCALLCATCLIFAGCANNANSAQEPQETNQEAASENAQNSDTSSDASKEAEQKKSSSATPLFEFDLSKGEQSESVTIQENTNLQMEAEITAGEATLTITEAGGYAAFSRSLSGEVFQTIDGLAPGTYTVTVSGDAEGNVTFSQIAAGK